MATPRTLAPVTTDGGQRRTVEIFTRRESQVRSYCRSMDAVVDTAQGSIVRDVQGREYIDFLAGAGSLNYGHNDPDLKAALLSYLSRDGIAHSLDLHTAAKGDFLETFQSLVLAPRRLEHRVQFTGPTGTNAVEAALKLARKVTGRRNVIAFTRGFHGVSLGSLAATANSHHRVTPTSSLPDVTRMPYDGYLGADVDTADLLEQMLADPSSGIDPPAAILLEAVQGEGGLNAATPQWLRRVAALAQQHGALLIVDDIQAGCGRTGTFFSFESAQITPDLITLSKSLSGLGLPLAVLLIRPDLDQWEPGEHNGTFRGNNHAFVTARAALEKFWADDRLSTLVAAHSVEVTRELLRMATVVPGARVKGRGMMQGLDVRSGELATEIRRHCLSNGLIIESAGAHDEVLKVFAPLTTPDDVLARGLGTLADAVVASSYMVEHTPRPSPNGQPATPALPARPATNGTTNGQEPTPALHAPPTTNGQEATPALSAPAMGNGQKVIATLPAHASTNGRRAKVAPPAG